MLLRSGEVGIAIRATVSSTPLFEPVQINGRWLIDGAAVNPVPIAPLRNEVDIIIASSVIVPIEKRKQHPFHRLCKLPNLTAMGPNGHACPLSPPAPTSFGRPFPLFSDFDLFDASDAEASFAVGLVAVSDDAQRTMSLLYSMR